MTHAQHAEDDMILRLFEGKAGHYACEVGMMDGMFYSNTLLLEEKGWDVLCIEPNPAFEVELKKNRKRVVMAAVTDKEGEIGFTIYRRGNYTHIHSQVGVSEPLTPEFIDAFCRDIKEISHINVPTITLDAELVRQGFPRLDFLSIDTDGSEPTVLRGFTIKKWNPFLVLVENPFSKPEITDYFTSSGYWKRDYIGENELWERK
jgi:FkbM family methyltransferase